MRSFTRRLATATAAALLCAGAVVPAATAGPGAVVIDDHDSHIAPLAYDISSSTGGTVYATDDGGFGQVFLAPAPMTTASTRIDLGPRPRTMFPPTISGSRVAMPQRSPGTGYDTPATSVRSCTIGICPAMSTLAVTAGWRYIGNADDRAIVFNPTTNTVGLSTWTGTPPAITHTYVMPVTYSEVPTAVGDVNGIAVSGGGEVTFVDRTDGSIHYLDYGDGAVLTPSYVVWYAVGVGDGWDETRIHRVARSTTEASPVAGLVHSLPGAPGITTLAANDAGAAWLESNDDGTDSLWSMTYAGAPVKYARPLTTDGLAAFEATGQFLVNDRRAGTPGLYRVAPGAFTGTLTGLVPVRGAITYDVSVSNGRAVYVDDTTENLPMFTRSVANGVAGPESVFTDLTAGSVALSGPYVVFTRPGPSNAEINVVYGRTDGTLTTRTFPIHEVGTVTVSGRRALLTGGERARVIDIPTGAVTDLGHVYAAIFGEYVGMINYDTGAVTRRNLDNATTQTVRGPVAGCTTFCVDEDNSHIAVWGHEVVYAFQYGGSAPGVAAALWNGNAPALSATTPLPMLTSGGEPLWTEIAYWSGLLLLARNDATVRLYDMRNGAAEREVDSFAEEPFSMDGNVVAWRPLSDLKAVVRDVRDFYPGHTPDTRYLGGTVPAAFGPGLATDVWKPTFLLSQEATGSVVIRSGSASGPVVATIPVGTTYGELRASWEGTDDAGADLPQGTYHWSIENAGGTALIQRASGTAPAGGSVYLSRTPLAAPALTAPALSTDVSATTTFPLSWTVPPGAPSGTRYVVQRSVNGGAWATSTETTATTLSYGGAAGSTYRFRVAAKDPAGRMGGFSAVRTTVVPYNDNATGTTYAGTWSTGLSPSTYGGSHRYSSAAGATYTFKATGTAIHLVGTRSTNYGQFQVSIDGGAYSGLVDSYSSSLQFRKVLYSVGRLSNTVHTIRVRVYGTRGRPYVGIDGVGYLR